MELSLSGEPRFVNVISRAPAIVYIVLVVIIAFTSTRLSSSETGNEYIKGYFGEPIGGLNAKELEQFQLGFQLFVRRWPISGTNPRNADSCVSCHNIPMPGGSGTDSMTFVTVDDSLPPQNPMRIVQRYGRKRLGDHNYSVLRTRPLFGLGYIESAETGTNANLIGSFGLTKTIDEFVAIAFASELGLSSIGHCATLEKILSSSEGCGQDIDIDQISALSTFVRLLAAPKPPNENANGEAIFQGIGCYSCHQKTIATKPTGYRPLAAHTIIAFSDLKIHKVRGVWPLRTAPLWGLNSFGPPYMHDGCGKDLETAILCHSGEASSQVEAYLKLDESQKSTLLEYLKGL